MSKRRRLVAFLAATGAIGLMATLLAAFSPKASADDASAAPSLSDPTDHEPPNPPDEGGDFQIPAEPAQPDSEEPPPRDFFKLYPAGEGKDAQAYEELDTDAQQATDAAALWAETGNGHTVHSRWSGVARQKRELANAKRAQALSGTQGLGELGVR